MTLKIKDPKSDKVVMEFLEDGTEWIDPEWKDAKEKEKAEKKKKEKKDEKDSTGTGDTKQ